MTLDLSTLKVGDIVRHVSNGATRLVTGVGRQSVLIMVDGNPDEEQWIDASGVPFWSVVVPPPPCPITEQVTTGYIQDPQWPGRFLRLASPITLHPPGSFEHAPPPEGRCGIYTWGDPS
jgi:hypothetical protein